MTPRDYYIRLRNGNLVGAVVSAASRAEALDRYCAKRCLSIRSSFVIISFKPADGIFYERITQ